jgi:hypothetical protein
MIFGVPPWKRELGNTDLERWQWHKNIFTVTTKTNKASGHASFDITEITANKSISFMNG